MEAGGNVQKLKLNPHCFKIIHQSHGLWLKRASTTCKHGGGRGGLALQDLFLFKMKRLFSSPSRRIRVNNKNNQIAGI
jgi:hypothetical protein